MQISAMRVGRDLSDFAAFDNQEVVLKLIHNITSSYYIWVGSLFSSPNIVAVLTVYTVGSGR